jgi:hypothetical protein
MDQRFSDYWCSYTGTAGYQDLGMRCFSSPS